MLMLLFPRPAPLAGRLLNHRVAAVQFEVYPRLFTMEAASGSDVRLTSCLSITMDAEKESRDSKRSAAKRELRCLRVAIFQVFVGRKV